jgi:multidrug transporter EmrE-like cation transporter
MRLFSSWILPSYWLRRDGALKHIYSYSPQKLTFYVQIRESPKIDVGVAYAAWSGLGTALIAALGVIVLKGLKKTAEKRSFEMAQIEL